MGVEHRLSRVRPVVVPEMREATLHLETPLYGGHELVGEVLLFLRSGRNDYKEDISWGACCRCERQLGCWVMLGSKCCGD